MPAFPSPPDERESLELVARIQRGDRAAWDGLYSRYHDQLLLAIRMRLGSGLRRHLQSEDILQSVALEAFQELDAFEYRGRGSLERFLQRLVIHKIRDRADTFRAEKRAGAVPLDEEVSRSLSAPDAESDGYHDGERYERLERALRALPEDLREVLLLRKLDGLSSKETAERLGKSDDAVRKTYSRALARLTLLVAEPQRRADSDGAAR